MRVSIHGLADFGLTLSQFWKLNPTTVLECRVSTRRPNERRLLALPPDERARRVRERTVSELRSLVRRHRRDIRFVFVRTIARRKKRAPARHFGWYAVMARFAAQVEGQTSGLQEYEDLTLIVKAWSESDAVGRLRRRFKDYGKPYLNLDYRLVHWKLEEVLRVSGLLEPIDERGTEIMSVFKSRRLKRSRTRNSRKQ